MPRNSFAFFILCLLFACGKPGDQQRKNDNTLFHSVSAKDSGIDFENNLEVSEDFDVFRYRNYYNGGGVAIGDINNDGLADVYLTSNMGDNKLFLNKGNWKFEDITTTAGVAGTKFWSTGVSMADVNADGLLDIYVCNSGDIRGDNRDNELFINNGNNTFTDRAAEYGLDDKGFSTHAAFFDFDKDGDLDCYVLNNSFRPVASLGYRNLRNERDPLGGHKLFRNDNGRFVDISAAAGIYGSVIGFGLGVTVGDVNQDNWPDMYISNDFYERDYLYINNHDGTFSEKLTEYFDHLSMFSMGADMADINNDGLPEIFSTDMLPEDDHRLKTMTAFETYDVYQLRLRNGYYHQFMQNMLHLNNGDGTFSEIGQLAGVAATDWSWGALMADFDNDSRKEIFVSNGIFKDVTNQDFVEFLGASQQLQDAIAGKKVNFKEFVNKMPSRKLSNYLFVQDSNFHFANKSGEWGLDEPGFSNGAAYGDLDNDGDLDLIVNNVNNPCFIYRNDSQQKLKNNFIILSFKGYAKNTFGLGAVVKIYSGNKILYYENMPIRGFQSSMDYRMTIGLGKAPVDSMTVVWPDDQVERWTTVPLNQSMVVDHADAVAPPAGKSEGQIKPLFTRSADTTVVHHENGFNDFDRDRLQYQMLSTQGPAFAVADLTNDGLDDFYVGGSVGNPGSLFVQTADGRFMKSNSGDIGKQSLADETDAVFFDADGDKDLDLYVVTGGSEFTSPSTQLLDIFFENKGLSNGVPQFVVTKGKLPLMYQSGSCVRPIDLDKDGDLDLFVGTRVLPAFYGLPSDQFILINDGKGTFTDGTSTWAPEFRKLGMVTDAQWYDYDHDGNVDLFMVGEWMPVAIYKNDGKRLTRVAEPGFVNSEGWWNRIVPADLDADGDMDFVLGNVGLNCKFKPSATSPLSLYVNDFDQNGSDEPVFAFERNGNEYPFALRQDIVKQMSSLKKKFVYYEEYANKSIADIFDPKLLKESVHLKLTEARTSVLMNNGNAFTLKSLPAEAQFAPVYGIAVDDVTKDGNPDIILGGNIYAIKPEVGRLDALHGLVLRGDKKGNFVPLSSSESGIKVQGEVRHIGFLTTKKGPLLAVVRNNTSVTFYKESK